MLNRWLAVGLLCAGSAGCNFHVAGLQPGDAAVGDGSVADQAIAPSDLPLVDLAGVDSAGLPTDLAGALDLNAALDLPAPLDLNASHDLRTPPRDFAAPRDFATLRDLLPPPDFDTPRDLATPPDLSPVVGHLSCTVADSSGTTINLTTGQPANQPSTNATTDWAHWGTFDTTTVERKSGNAHPIGDFSQVGAATVTRYIDSKVTFTWIGGAPNGTSAGTTTGIYLGGTGHGFSLPITATTRSHVVRLYVSAFNADYTMTGHLSDNSAGDYTESETRAGIGSNSYRVYTCSFNAASAAQLIFTWSASNAHLGGNVTLESATLQ